MIVTRTNAFADYGQYYRDARLTPEVLRPVHQAQLDAVASGASGAGRIRPSLFGFGCDRAQVLSYNGHAVHRDGSWYTWSGTWMHLAFQTWLLTRMGEQVTIEATVTGRGLLAGVSGHADWLYSGPTRPWIDLPEYDTDVVVHGPHVGDYKTIGTVASLKGAPKPAHIQQLLLEMAVFEVRDAYLVYQGRSHGDLAAFRLEADDADIEAVESKVSSLKSHIVDGTLPSVLAPCEQRKGRLYQWCAAREKCLEGTENEG